MDKSIEEALAGYGIKVMSDDPLEIAMIDNPKSIAIGDLAELLVYTLLYDVDDDEIDDIIESEHYLDEEPYWDNTVDEDREY